MGPQNPEPAVVNADLEPGLNDQKPQSFEGSQDNDEKTALEEAPPSYMNREDPFGNEETAEVKYRTMSWWYVSHTVTLYLSAFLTWMQASWNECARSLSLGIQ